MASLVPIDSFWPLVCQNNGKPEITNLRKCFFFFFFTPHPWGGNLSLAGIHLTKQHTVEYLCVWLCGWRSDREPVACVVNSRYFQQSLTRGNLTLSLDPVWVISEGVVYVCVCAYVGRMNVIEFILLREGQLCSLPVQGKHLTVIAHVDICTLTKH